MNTQTHMRQIEVLITNAGRSAVVLRGSRTQAHQAAVRVLRGLESRLLGALEGDTLRGLSNLLPNADRRFKALSLRSKYGDEPLPFDGRAVLVLTQEGRLSMAYRHNDTSLQPCSANVVVWDVSDNELNAEDLVLAVPKIINALQTHLTRIEKTADRFDRIKDLAERMAQSFGFSLPEVPRGELTHE